MKTNSGKGYFYSMGAKDVVNHKFEYHFERMKWYMKNRDLECWPEWAQKAYLSGYNGYGL